MTALSHYWTRLYLANSGWTINFQQELDEGKLLDNFAEGLPSGLDTQSIATHTRHVWARDETVYNGDQSMFVAAFNVFEHSMMNDAGFLLGAKLKTKNPLISTISKIYLLTAENGHLQNGSRKQVLL